MLRTIQDPQAVADWLRERGVRALHCDSRRVGMGDGFVAWPGAATDGRRFVPGALQAGAVAAHTTMYRRTIATLRVRCAV